MIVIWCWVQLEHMEMARDDELNVKIAGMKSEDQGKSIAVLP